MYKAGPVIECFWPLTVSYCMTIPGQLVRGRSRWLVGRGGWTESRGRESGQQGAPLRSYWAGHGLQSKYCSGCTHSPSAQGKRTSWMKTAGRGTVKSQETLVDIKRIWPHVFCSVNAHASSTLSIQDVVVVMVTIGLLMKAIGSTSGTRCLTIWAKD